MIQIHHITKQRFIDLLECCHNKHHRLEFDFKEIPMCYGSRMVFVYGLGLFQLYRNELMDGSTEDLIALRGFGIDKNRIISANEYSAVVKAIDFNLNPDGVVLLHPNGMLFINRYKRIYRIISGSIIDIKEVGLKKFMKP